MPFVDQIIRYGSLSVVGLGKNTGKTECLNYVMRRLSEMRKVVAVTSIGIDGEGVDQVTFTPKPSIYLEKGMYFTTLSSFYTRKQFQAEICHVENAGTVLGKMVTARVLERGKMVLAGPSDTVSLQRWVSRIPERFPVDVCLVDGAISRLSSASPVVTRSMVLATGAAYSANVRTLVERTRFVYDTVRLPQAPSGLREKLEQVTKGIRIITDKGEITDPGVRSVLLPDQVRKVLETGGNRLYVPGVVGNALLKALGERKEAGETELYVRDFSRIFAEPRVFYSFLRKGGRILQLFTTHLLAICVNPLSPEGIRLKSEELVDKMQRVVEVPVYDIKKIRS
ncbi:MAG TPA: hypothetical protein PK676_05200 [Bacteroidales bacterium]|nr:hypothetical protein [Bacteroidales bacterium]HQB56202.1 hypothetical protein [Bacteroidales bacterium]